MSRTIEQKVVEMRFDNSNFEKNVSQSMTSLNQLKETIDKTSSANAFSGLSKALDNINLGTVTTAIQSVTEKFSLWEEIAIGAARNVGAALSNYVAKGLNDMVFTNIYAGWDKYATKTEAVQTIMASIADQDFGNVDKMEYVENLMEKLNWFTDETSYHLTDMISSIGKFTSAGVDLDAAAESMMGIANWAAVSGANADTASRVMSQLSQSLGLGAVRVQDWMSVETANMATKEFKELAIAVGKAHNTINAQGIVGDGKNAKEVTFKNFRETLKYNWLTSDVLNDTLKQYSGFSNALNRVYDAYGGNVPTSVLIKRFDDVRKKASDTGKTLEQVFKEEYKLDVDFSVLDKNGNVIGNLADNITELGIRAFKAAQEAKTFKEAVDSVGDAASTIWMRVYETIFGNYLEAKELWTGLANDLYELFVEPIWAVSELMDKWRKLGGRDLLFGREEDEEGEVVPIGAFDMFMQSIINVRDALDKAFGSKFKIDEVKLIKFTKKVKEVASKFYDWTSDTEKLTKKFQKFFDWIESGILYFKEIADKTNIFRDALDNVKRAINYVKIVFDNTFKGFLLPLESAKAQLGIVQDKIINLINSLKIGKDVFYVFEEALRQIAGLARSLVFAVGPVSSLFNGFLTDLSKLGSFISGNLLKVVLKAIADIAQFAKEMSLLWRTSRLTINVLKAFKEGFRSAFDSEVFAEVRFYLKSLLDAVKTFTDGLQVGERTFDKIRTIGKGVASAINLLGRAFSFLLRPIKALVDSSFFTDFGKFLSGTVLNAILSIPEAIAKIITKIDEYLKTHPELMDKWEEIIGAFGHIARFAMDAATAFADFIKKSKPLEKVGTLIRNIFSGLKESTVLTKFGENVSSSFEKILKFFREDFYLDSFKDKIKEVGASINEFIDGSEFLSSARKALIDFWGSAKKLFSEDFDSSQIGSKFDEIATSIWNFAKKAGKAIKYFFGGLFGSEENESALDEMAVKARSLGEKVSNVFKAVIDFSKGLFGSNNAENSLEETKTGAEELGIKVSGILKTIWNAIKSVAKGIATVATVIYGFISTIASKVKELFASGKESGFFDKISGFFKGLFGDKGSDESSLDDSTNKAKAFGEKVSTIFNAIWTALKWAWDKIEFAYKALKKLWEDLGIGEWLTGLVKDIGKAFSDLIEKLKPIETDSGDASDKFDKVATNVSGIFKGLAKILGSMIPAFLAGSFISGLMALVHPIKSLGEIVNVIIGAVASYNVSEKIKATGAAISDVIKALGSFVLSLAGATVILAYADTISGGNLTDIYKSLAWFIAEIVGTIGLILSIMGETNKLNSQTGSITKNGIMASTTSNSIADTVKALGDVFAEIGKAMLMLAGSVAILVAIDKLNPGNLWTAFGVIEAFMVTLLGIGILVMKLTDDQTTVSASLSKKGFALEGSGYVEGLYLLGSFMKNVATALLMVSAATALIIKSADGDTKTMLIAFGFMETALLTLIGGAILITKLSTKMGGADSSSSVAVKLSGFAAFFISAALAIGMIAKTVISLTKYQPTKLNKGFEVVLKISAVIGALAIIGGIFKNGSFASMGFMMLEAAASIAIIGSVVKSISELNETGVQKAIDVIIAVGVIFGVLVAAASLINAGAIKLLGFGAALIEIASAFAIMGLVVKMLSSIDVTQMGVAIDGLIAMSAALVVMFGIVALASKNAVGILVASAALVTMSVALGLVMVAMMAAGLVFSKNEGAFGKAAAAIIIVVAAIAALALIAEITGPAMLVFGAGLAAVGIGVAAIGAGILLAALAINVIAKTLAFVVKTALELGPKFGEALKMFFKGIADAAPEMTKALIAIIGGFTVAIIENLEGIVTVIFEILKKLLQLLAENLPEILGYVTTIVNAIVDLVLNVLLNAINTFINGEDGVLVILNQALFGENGILHMINLAISGDNGILGMIDKALFGEHGILTMLRTLINGNDGVLVMIKTALVGENGILSIIKDALVGENGMLHIIRDVLVGENGALSILRDALFGESGALTIVDEALMGEHGILTIVDAFVIALFETMRGWSTEIVDTVLYLISEAIRGIVEGTDSVLTGVEELITTIAEHIVSLNNVIFQAVIDVIEGLATTIETHSGDFWAAVKHLVRAIWNSFWGIFNGGENDENSISHLAKNIMAGLGQGIKDFVGEVTNGIVSIGSTVVGKFKEIFGIHSPSKVMAQIGGYLDSGLASGIANNANLPVGSIQDVGNKVIDYLKDKFGGSDVSGIGELFGDTLGGSMEDALSGITDGIDSGGLLDGEIGDSLSSALGGISDSLESEDYTPTITPVLDLSEIQNGADQIPGILGTDSNYGYTVGSGTTSAVRNASYSPYEYYDGTEKKSNEEAQTLYWDQLQAKMEEIANKFGRAKVILDTGAVVGGLLDPMDVALGNKMAQVGRGVYSSTR